ncbi:DUF5777 family beta-barrel protein [Salibacteraceae bacterium]|jgi:hypothetical protein|nr:DUF5777 family beta-barrel protein [Salibacteraceae bacterium]MDB9709000.1 DUF5777 family beta-barrel protein [Salibacteraceae bacterium]MDC1305157.1 DUF5777 family beta-barrel protein [Salibacteraceae bacterium]
MTFHNLLFSCVLMASSLVLNAQESMLDLLSDDEPTVDYATAGFKTTRIINGHSFEMNSEGVLDFKISHRFGRLNGGAYELFGLDAASIRIGLDYGVTPWLNVGVGRSSVGKVYDGFVKMKFLRQQTGKRNIPISMLWVSDMAVSSLKNTNSEIEPYLNSHRLFYTHQLIVGRKFTDGISVQFMPSIVHRNFVMTRAESNDVLVLGVGGRMKLSKRVALNVEYYYTLPNQLDPRYTNSLSIGFDIETGGHVFQLHFTNSTGMVENAFMTETTGDWLKGDIHFGFNVSRVFTLYRPKG